MPEPKLRPSGPSTSTTPPVMYSQPCWPTPSTTARAPLLRIANRSPARPATKSCPEVAPYKTVLPTSTSPLREALGPEEIEIVPPEKIGRASCREREEESGGGVA